MAKKEEKTNAVRTLEQKKIRFETHTYEGTPEMTGEDIAAVLGENPDCVYKTLVTEGKSGNHYVFLVQVARELDLKKAAAAVGEKNVTMLKAKDLLPLTGYVHGGCSPLGMKKFFKTVLHLTAKEQEKIMFSGGKIGLQIETDAQELAKVIPFVFADVEID